MTEREQFCAVLANGPLLQSDAIVLLCGEDAEPRLSVAAELMNKGGARVVLLTGGLHDPPRHNGADEFAPLLMGAGVAPGRILTDNAAQNTHEQAVNAIDLAREKDWRRLLLVASGYHQYRAYLTFVRTLLDGGLDKTIQLVNVPASHVPWWGVPAGMGDARVELLAREFAKIEEYADHVASYREGLDYLRHWERHEPKWPEVSDDDAG